MNMHLRVYVDDVSSSIDYAKCSKFDLKRKLQIVELFAKVE